MKKVFILALLLLIAGNVFSDFQLGPYVVYKLPINKADLPGVRAFGIEDFWFGLDFWFGRGFCFSGKRPHCHTQQYYQNQRQNAFGHVFPPLWSGVDKGKIILAN